MSENRFLFPKHSPNRVLGRCSLEDVLRKELANKWDSADMDTCKVFTFHDSSLIKDHWTLKTGYFEGPTPAMQVQTLPLEGPRSLGFEERLLRILIKVKSPT